MALLFVHVWTIVGFSFESGVGMEEMSDKLLILYATQTGNALDAAEQIYREAERRGCPVVIRSIDDYDIVSYFKFCVVFFPVLVLTTLYYLDFFYRVSFLHAV